MGTSSYILIAVLWLLICTGLALYIMGIGMSEKKQFTIGLQGIFISWVVGACMLFAMLMFF